MSGPDSEDHRTLRDKLLDERLRAHRSDLEVWIERAFYNGDLRAHERWHREQELKALRHELDGRAMRAGAVRGVILAAAIILGVGVSVLMLLTFWSK